MVTGLNKLVISKNVNNEIPFSSWNRMAPVINIIDMVITPEKDKWLWLKHEETRLTRALIGWCAVRWIQWKNANLLDGSPKETNYTTKSYFIVWIGTKNCLTSINEVHLTALNNVPNSSNGIPSRFFQNMKKYY